MATQTTAGTTAAATVPIDVATGRPAIIDHSGGVYQSLGERDYEFEARRKEQCKKLGIKYYRTATLEDWERWNDAYVIRLAGYREREQKDRERYEKAIGAIWYVVSWPFAGWSSSSSSSSSSPPQQQSSSAPTEINPVTETNTNRSIDVAINQQQSNNCEIAVTKPVAEEEGNHTDNETEEETKEEGYRYYFEGEGMELAQF